MIGKCDRVFVLIVSESETLDAQMNSLILQAEQARIDNNYKLLHEKIGLATEKYNKPNPINLGSGTEITIENLVKKVCELMDFKGEIHWETTKPDGQPRRILDVSKAEKMRGDTCAGSDEIIRRQPAVNKVIWESLGEWDLSVELNSLKIPTLVIHGSYDMIPIESSIAWVEAMPNSRLLVIEDSGHMTHIEQPETFFSAVEKFLGGSWPEDAIQITGRDDAESLPSIEINRP